MNKMKEELGLIINQEDMVSKHIDDFNVVIKSLQCVCDYIKENENRETITAKDINRYSNINISYNNSQKRCLENNTSVRKVIEDYGFKMQDEGNGLVHRFIDGEKTTSQYELDFSNKLRDYGYIFNNTYFRDILYNNIDNNYKGLMNCDYKIMINNKIAYIEIAGMLRDYKDIYKENKIENIKSKSKRNYANKLKQKEEIFIKNNLEYYILFPSDLKDLDGLFNEIGITKQNKI